MSYSSVASQHNRKTPKFSVFSGDPTKKSEVSFKQWAFRVKSVMQSHTEATLREGMICLLWEAMADLVLYLGPHAPVSEINKLEVVYGTIASFDVLMQNLYRLQQGKMEKVLVYVKWLEGALNAAQQEYPNLLSMGEVQKHLTDCLFHGLCKQLYDSMH